MLKVNFVEELFEDKKQGTFALKINGQTISGVILTQRVGQTNRLKHTYTIKVSNDFNMSSPFRIDARNLNSLIRKLENHKYKLVKSY